MENISSIDFVAINFENCEQIVVPARNIKPLLKGTDRCDNDRSIYLILDKEADVRYECMGYDPQMTIFGRILSRADIVSIGWQKKNGNGTEAYVPYIEDERGYNAAEKCWIDETEALHIKIEEENTVSRG